MLSLASRAFDVSRLLDVDVRLDADEGNDAVVERLDEWHLLGWVWREILLAQLHVEVEGVFVVLTFNGDEILRCEDWELGEHGLYLTWEDVDTTDDEHIVAATQNLPGEITCAPRGNHVGPQGKSRGPPGEITWAARGKIYL